MKVDATRQVMIEFLRLIYCDKVNNLIAIAGDLLSVAQIFHLESLKRLCCKSLLDNLAVSNVTRIANIADSNGANELRNLCVTFVAKSVCVIIFFNSFFLFYFSYNRNYHLVAITEDWKNLKNVNFLKDVSSY